MKNGWDVQARSAISLESNILWIVICNDVVQPVHSMLMSIFLLLDVYLHSMFNACLQCEHGSSDASHQKKNSFKYTRKNRAYFRWIICKILKGIVPRNNKITRKKRSKTLGNMAYRCSTLIVRFVFIHIRYFFLLASKNDSRYNWIMGIR